MKLYPKYKDSGVEWIGEVPEGWEVKKLKYSDKVIMGQSPSSDDYNDLNVGFPFLQGNADFTSLYPNPRIWCETAKKYAEKNDVLLSVRAPIGAVNIADQKYGIGRGLCAIRSIQSLPVLLFYFALSLNSELKRIGTGSTYTAISVVDVENIFIPNISSTEQKSIAAYLDHKTAQIDDLISKKQKLIELLKEERSAIINQAVTKGLNPDVPMKDSGIEWIWEIPAHWEVKRLKYIARITLGKMLTNVDKGGYHYRPYLRAQNINWEKVNVEDVKKMWFSKDELHQYRLNKNDLLVSEGGEVGRTSMWDEEIEECYIQNSVHKVTMKPTNDPFFFLYAFCLFGEKGVFESVASRISIAHLTKEKLKETVFPVPPNDEQERISKFISAETTKIDQTISKIKKQIDLLKEFRTSLISEAVTGKIDVRNEGSNG